MLQDLYVNEPVLGEVTVHPQASAVRRASINYKGDGASAGPRSKPQQAGGGERLLPLNF